MPLVNNKIIAGIRTLQLPNGCFTAAKDGTESDMRFLYCAAAICYMLDDFSGMDVDKAAQFIVDSMVCINQQVVFIFKNFNYNIFSPMIMELLKDLTWSPTGALAFVE